MENIINALRKFGLTSYQAKAYVTMIREGEINAKEISEKAGIPYAKIHNVLLSLRDKGWITIEEGKPKRYRAKPPIQVIEELMKNEMENLKFQGNRIIEELQPIYERIGLEEKSEIIILKGENIIIEKALNSLKNVRRNLDIAISGGILEIHGKILGALMNLKRKVKVRILLDEKTLNTINTIDLTSDYGFEINVRKEMFGGGLIIDDEETIILLSGGSRNLIAIWSNNKDLTKIAKIYFEYLWNINF